MLPIYHMSVKIMSLNPFKMYKIADYMQPVLDLTRFNKIAIQGTPQMAVD